MDRTDQPVCVLGSCGAWMERGAKWGFRSECGWAETGWGDCEGVIGGERGVISRHEGNNQVWGIVRLKVWPEPWESKEIGVLEGDLSKEGNTHQGGQ